MNKNSASIRCVASTPWCTGCPVQNFVRLQYACNERSHTDMQFASLPWKYCEMIQDMAKSLSTGFVCLQVYPSKYLSADIASGGGEDNPHDTTLPALPAFYSLPCSSMCSVSIGSQETLQTAHVMVKKILSAVFFNSFSYSVVIFEKITERSVSTGSQETLLRVNSFVKFAQCSVS